MFGFSFRTSARRRSGLCNCFVLVGVRVLLCVIDFVLVYVFTLSNRFRSRRCSGFSFRTSRCLCPCASR